MENKSIGWRAWKLGRAGHRYIAMFVKPSGAERARARRESPRSGSSDKHVHPAPDNRGPRLPAAIPCRRVAWPRIPMLLAKSAKMPQMPRKSQGGGVFARPIFEPIRFGNVTNQYRRFIKAVGAAFSACHWKGAQMPTYFCTSTNGRLNSEQKSKIACEITGIQADHRRRLAGSRRLVNHLSATEH